MRLQEEDSFLEAEHKEILFLRIKHTLTPLFFLLLMLISNVSLAGAVLPLFSSHEVGYNTPFVDESTTVTVTFNFLLPEIGDVSSLVGTLSVQLFWSRDLSTWHVITMALISGNNKYRATIPAQDGSDNHLYDYGDGTLFFYIRLRDTTTGEEDYLFSQADPSSEIVFLPLPSVTTSGIEETVTVIPSPNPVGQVVEDIFKNIVGRDVASDPLFQSIVIIIFGILVAGVLFTGGAHRVLRRVFGVFTGNRIR